MDYITVKEAAEKWGITARWAQVLCAQFPVLSVLPTPTPRQYQRMQ
ncbi:hypothetical protein DSOL_5261 [Desulfosporosinus metallidurans]|uniref:DNA-binding protein n=1 Tax=Desulfosporosinus metallidurans TaxID=1888891 RepID=A0A1Q8QEE6_9FIRM|nr:hypothetical protein DSOL_5261 [Desulfosporosinus metallidurans]